MLMRLAVAQCCDKFRDAVVLGSEMDTDWLQEIDRRRNTSSALVA